jgi:DNA-binding MarR family transcriptional regulator
VTAPTSPRPIAGKYDAPMARRVVTSGAPRLPDLGHVAEVWAQERPDINTDSLLLVTTMQRLSQNLERAFVEICRRYELGPGDVRILLSLRRSPPDYALSPSDLFRQLLITSGAVTKQVDRLVDAGLVAKLADPDVLRGLLVELQPEGRRIADEIIEAICSYPWLERLTDRRKQQTLRLLSAIVADMDSDADA